jgi:hypothetical protein
MQDNGAAVDDGDHAVSVLLRLVDPRVTFREFGDALALHRLDESRTRFGIADYPLNHAASGYINVGRTEDETQAPLRRGTGGAP